MEALSNALEFTSGEFTSGSDTLSVDPALTLSVAKNSGGSAILRAEAQETEGFKGSARDETEGSAS